MGNLPSRPPPTYGEARQHKIKRSEHMAVAAKATKERAAMILETTTSAEDNSPIRQTAVAAAAVLSISADQLDRGGREFTKRDLVAIISVMKKLDAPHVLAAYQLMTCEDLRAAIRCETYGNLGSVDAIDTNNKLMPSSTDSMMTMTTTSSGIPSLVSVMQALSAIQPPAYQQPSAPFYSNEEEVNRPPEFAPISYV